MIYLLGVLVIIKQYFFLEHFSVNECLHFNIKGF